MLIYLFIEIRDAQQKGGKYYYSWISFFLFLLRFFYVKIKYLHTYLGKVNFSLKTDVVLCLPQYCFNGS